MVSGGLLIVDKPAGWTSHDVVGRVRRLYGLKRVGHAGTLDPAATGVLVVGLGTGCRVLEYLLGQDKAYRAEVTFGRRTDSYDGEGAVVEERDATGLDAVGVAELLGRFRGEIEQLPPMASAKKVGGRPLYKLHRQGREVTRATCRVTLARLELVDFVAGRQPTATLAIECSSGTYVRSLADDLGRAAGVGAYLSALRRTRVGPFELADAVILDELTALDPAAREARLRPLLDGVRHLPAVMVPGALVADVTCGKLVALEAEPVAGPVRLMSDDGRLLALGHWRETGWQPRKVLVEPEGSGASRPNTGER